MRPKDKRDVDDSIFGPALERSHVAESRFVLRLFFLTAGVLASAAAVTFVLSRLYLPPHATQGTFVVPMAFAFSTLFLLLCSAELERAVSSVRRERQRPFRRAMLWALAFGTLFVGVQVFGLWSIVEHLKPDRNAGEAELGPTAAVLGAAALHCLHVIVALMFLSYVTLQVLSDRYDHEYSFGVSVCAWFWHILGILWIFILGAYEAVSWFLAMRVPVA